MLLDAPIGYDPDDNSSYIDGALFQRELFELDNLGYKCIKIHINSPGGNVVDGFNICNAILTSKTPVDTYNIGIAASMAGIIWMTGRKRIMADYATMMIHNPAGGDDQKMLKALRQSTIKILSAKCKMTEDEIDYVMNRETWFTASECLEKGFCTDIVATSSSNQKRMPTASTSIRAAWNSAKLIQNNIYNSDHMADVTGKSTDLSLIASYLDLSVDASSASIMQTMKAKINAEIVAKEKAEDELAKTKKAIDKMKADLDEMTEKYNALKKEKEEAEATAKAAKDAADAKAAKDAADAKAAKEEAEKATARVTAKAKIDTYATAGRIKKEEVDGWVEDALVLGLDKVSARIEALPFNKTGVATTAAAGQQGQQGRDGVVDPNVVPANTMAYQAKILAAQKARAKAVSAAPATN